jgi:MoxR-like ATPase
MPMLLIGPAGIGKTHFVTALARVQGKGLVPTFSALQKTWQRPPAQGVAPRP